MYMNYQNCPLSIKTICVKKVIIEMYFCQFRRRKNTKIVSLNTTKGMDNMNWLHGLFNGMLHIMLFLLIVYE